MTHRDDLQFLRTIAKRLARGTRLPHHKALDLLASKLGQPHWNAMTTAWNSGWRPDLADAESISAYCDHAGPDLMSVPTLGIGLGVEEEGVLDGHPYTMNIDFEVLMGGRGWAICVEQAPSEKPAIERYDNRADNPLLDPAFVAKALVLCHAAAERLRARIAFDWPRRSTKPDAEGRTVHPLFDRGLSNQWYCLHCDEVSTGAQMADNMWHCPKCSATPIDIFSTPFWKGAA